MRPGLRSRTPKTSGLPPLIKQTLTLSKTLGSHRDNICQNNTNKTEQNKTNRLLLRQAAESFAYLMRCVTKHVRREWYRAAKGDGNLKPWMIPIGESPRRDSELQVIESPREALDLLSNRPLRFVAFDDLFEGHCWFGCLEILKT